MNYKIIKQALIEKKEYVFATSVWFLLILLLYGRFIFTDAQISPTNLMYSFAVPYSSYEIETEGPLLSDPVDQQLPPLYSIYKLHDSIFWNSDMAFGTANTLETVMYPLNWVFVLPMGIAFLLKCVLKTSIAYFGIYLLIRQIKCNNSSAIISALMYSCCSGMVTWFYWPHTDVMAFAPWAFLYADKMMQSKNFKYAIHLGMIIYLLIVAGMLSFAGYILYMVGFYVLFGAIINNKKHIKAIIKIYFFFASSVGLGLVMSLPYLKQMISEVIDNGYADSRLSMARSIFSFSYLRTFFLPYFRNELSITFTEGTFYIGLLGVLLVGLSFVYIRQIKNKYWPISAMILAVLLFTHWLDEIYVLMPAVNTSSRLRLVNPFALVLCVIVGLVFNQFNKSCSEKNSTIRYFIMRCIIYVVVVFVAVHYAKVEILFDGNEYKKMLVVLAGFIILLELYINGRNIKGKLVSYGLLLVFLFVDMIPFVEEYQPVIYGDVDMIPEPTESVEFLQNNLDDARIYPISGWTMFPNSNEYYNISSISGHGFVNTNQDVISYLKIVDDECYATVTNVHGQKVDNYNLLSWAGVKYIVCDKNSSANMEQGLKKVHEGNDGVDIYELEQYAPRIYLAENAVKIKKSELILDEMANLYKPNTVYFEKENGKDYNYTLSKTEELKVIQNEDDNVKVSVNLENGRYVVFNDYYNDDWNVYVDGELSNLEKVNYLFKGVYVEKGEHIVEFRYNSKNLIVLMFISSICFVSCIISLIVLTKKTSGGKL
ncbi:MAG: YfhO family protein [Lachnospiraceae bacterium]